MFLCTEDFKRGIRQVNNIVIHLKKQKQPRQTPTINFSGLFSKIFIYYDNET